VSEEEGEGEEGRPLPRGGKTIDRLDPEGGCEEGGLKCNELK
jgi:hypothetical protein